MNLLTSLFQIRVLAEATPLLAALILFIILVISFRSRAVVFCQYLGTMTGVRLSPRDVRRVFDSKGQTGVREMFLDLIIREDLKEGPISLPDGMVHGAELEIPRQAGTKA